MSTKDIAAYVGSAVSIALGVAGRWNPPPISIDNDFSIALIVGGLAALGVTVAVPAAVRTAREQGFSRARQGAASPQDKP